MNKKTKIISIILGSLVIFTGIFAYLQFNGAWSLNEEPKKTEEETPIVDRTIAEWEILETGTDKQTGISYQKQHNSDLGITVKIPTTWHITKEPNTSSKGSFGEFFSPMGIEYEDSNKTDETFAIMSFGRTEGITVAKETSIKNYLNDLKNDVSYTNIKYKNFDNVFFEDDISDNKYKKGYIIFMNDTTVFGITFYISSPNDKQKFEKYKVEGNFSLDSLEFDKI